MSTPPPATLLGPPHPSTPQRQRERLAACWMCGANVTPWGATPRTMTVNISALCDQHELWLRDQDQVQR